MAEPATRMPPDKASGLLSAGRGISPRADPRDDPPRTAHRVRERPRERYARRGARRVWRLLEGARAVEGGDTQAVHRLPCEHRALSTCRSPRARAAGAGRDG